MLLLAWTAIAAIALLSAAGWLGPWYEPADLASHFRLHLAFAAGLTALLFLRRSDVALAAVALLTVNLATALIYPHRPVMSGAHAAVRELKVVTFNTLWRADNARAIAGFLEREKPDLVLLQEIGPRKWAELEPLVASAYPWRTHCAQMGHCRVAVLSRHRWQRASAGFSGGARLPLARAEFGPALGNLTLMGVHLHRPLGWPREHRRQADHAARLAGQAKGPVILAGDFNAAPWSRTIRAFSDHGIAPAGWVRPTWPRRFSIALKWPLPPQLGLDHVLLPKGLGLRDVRNGPDLGSDHLPVVVRLEMPATR